MLEQHNYTNNWQVVAVSADSTLRDVLNKIDSGNMQIALVVDDDNHLIGTVTDGDVRRTLLRGGDMDTPVNETMNPNPITGLLNEEPMLWQRIMQRHTLRHLPLLDSNSCVVGIARYQMPQEPQRENSVILMAGGLGSRLQPLTKNHPKPLLEVGSKPILETIIENFASQGFYKIFLCINYKGEMIKQHFGDGKRWNVEIEYIEESKRMGTAGALSLLTSRPDRPFFVMNSDLLTKVDFVRLLHFHQKQQASATLCVREYNQQIPYGVIKLDGHQVKGLKEKPTHRFHINAGIYMLNPEALDLVPKDRYFDMPNLINGLLAENKQVSSFPIHEYWIDIGRMQEFERAHKDYDEQFQE